MSEGRGAGGPEGQRDVGVMTFCRSSPPTGATLGILDLSPSSLYPAFFSQFGTFLLNAYGLIAAEENKVLVPGLGAPLGLKGEAQRTQATVTQTTVASGTCQEQSMWGRRPRRPNI